METRSRKVLGGVIVFLVAITFPMLLGIEAVFSQAVTIKMGDADTVVELTLDKTNGEYASQNIKSQAFKRYIEQASNGRISVKIFPDCQLGGEREQWEMTKAGSLDMNGLSTGPLANFVPEVMATQIPYMFKDSNVALKVINGPVGQELVDVIVKKMGVRVLAWQHETNYNFMAMKKSIKVPEDLKGMKIRTVENPAIIEFTKLTGASPTPIPFNELYTSVQQGIVDGVNLGIVFVHFTGLDALIKHINLADPWLSLGTISINEKFYRSLSPQDQYLVKEAAMKASATYQGLAYMARDLWNEYLRNKGIEIYNPSSQEMEKWVSTLNPPMTQWVKKQIGPEWVDKIFKANKEAEQELYGHIK